MLKEFFATDYRGIVAILKDSSDLLRILELCTVPHFTTLQKAARTILSKKSIKKLISETVCILDVVVKDKDNKLSIAIDSTGLESHHISRYFVKRRERGAKELYQTTTYKRFPKLAIGCDITTHMIAGALPLRGPTVDIVHFKKLVEETKSCVSFDTLLADAGYDSEESHRFAREEHRVHAIIPPLIGRRTNKLPTGEYRREMAVNFDEQTYGQRWQAETVFSMIKRNLGEALSAKTYQGQCREIMLKVFTHNVMVLL